MNYIYKITNTISGKSYIGKTNRPQTRWQEHKRNSLEGSYAINEAIRKYDVKNFIFQVIEECNDNWEEREKYYIKFYNSLSPNGYNMTTGGEAGPGHRGFDNVQSTTSLETVKSIIKALKTKETMEEIAKNNNVCSNTVFRINYGTTYKIDGEKYPIRKRNLTKEEKEEIINLLLETDLSQREIGEKFEVKYGAVNSLNVGRGYKRKNVEYPLRTGQLSTKTKNKIYSLANQGLPYQEIALQIGVDWNTAKKHSSR